MSVVVPFPQARARLATSKVAPASPALHSVRGGSLISWVRPRSCSCCGRPTLAAPRFGADNETLCSHCTPPSIA